MAAGAADAVWSLFHILPDTRSGFPASRGTDCGIIPAGGGFAIVLDRSRASPQERGGSPGQSAAATAEGREELGYLPE